MTKNNLMRQNWRIFPAIFAVVLVAVLTIGLTACQTAPPGTSGSLLSGSASSSLSSAAQSASEETPLYQKITAEEAKKIMDEQKDAIVLDVRTQEEFAEGHIANALLLPYDEIAAKAASLLPDKAKTILVYCRSGRRSAIAAEELAKLGYKDVRDFGGIIDWPYDVVK